MDEMKVLYEDEDIFVKMRADGVVFVGYQRDNKTYQVYGVSESEFVGSSKCVLNFKRGANVITRVGYVSGDDSGIMYNHHWYLNMGNGRYEFEEVGEDEEVLCEALLQILDEKGEPVHGYLLGYVDDSEVA